MRWIPEWSTIVDYSRKCVMRLRTSSFHSRIFFAKKKRFKWIFMPHTILHLHGSYPVKSSSIKNLTIHISLDDAKNQIANLQLMDCWIYLNVMHHLQVELETRNSLDMWWGANMDKLLVLAPFRRLHFTDEQICKNTFLFS